MAEKQLYRVVVYWLNSYIKHVQQNVM